MKTVSFYTDGACSGNGKKEEGADNGGWAYVECTKCDSGIKTKVVSGNKTNTTNNEMELTAVYKALVKSLKAGYENVTIYTDSAYIVNAITKGWLCKWRINGWQTVEGKQIKNKQIWEKMFKLIYEKNIKLTMVKVKGHSTDMLNELADNAAVNARLELEK